MFFYTVSFPSAVWRPLWDALNLGSWCWFCTWEPHEDIPLDLQSRAESKRERGREKETLTCRGTRAPSLARTHAPPAARCPETGRSRHPMGASALLEKAGTVGPRSFPPGRPPRARAGPTPAPACPPHWETRVEKAYAPSPAQPPL